MSGLSRHACLLLALTSIGCSVVNPAFGLSTDGAGDTSDSTGGAASTGAPGDPSGPDTTAAPTTASSATSGTSAGSTTVEPGTTAMASSGAPEPFCGDGHQDPGEACDDGNNLDGDGCQADCSLASCGDGIIQGEEECDDSNAVDEDDCLSTCVLAVCSDGKVHAGVEECDDGNAIEGDGCSPNCALEVCGNGNFDPDEECDDGNTNPNDGCSPNCTKEICGDGIVQADEKCDDGNKIDTDKCKSDCTPGPCGNLLWDINGGEECDFSAEPFKSAPELCSDACTLKTCAKIVNTADSDIPNNNWFDPCVDAPGTTLHIVVVSLQNYAIKYKANGPKGLNWTYDIITSDAAPGNQHLLGGHLPILLNNNDLMYIFGRSGNPGVGVDPSKCPSSLGDGYSVAIKPPMGDAFKLIVASTNGGVTGVKRNLLNWTANHEISLNANGMGLCAPSQGPTAFTPAVAFFLVK